MGLPGSGCLFPCLSLYVLSCVSVCVSAAVSAWLRVSPGARASRMFLGVSSSVTLTVRGVCLSVPAGVARGVPLRSASRIRVLGSGYKWGMRQLLLPTVLPPFSKLPGGNRQEASATQYQERLYNSQDLAQWRAGVGFSSQSVGAEVGLPLGSSIHKFPATFYSIPALVLGPENSNGNTITNNNS